MLAFLHLFYVQDLNMLIKKDTCLIIPARSGSKGIPDKNIREINGKSLLKRTLDSASKLVNMHDICLSTDSDNYYSHIKDKYNPLYLKRCQELSGDKSLAIDVWKNAIDFFKKKERNYIFSIYLEPTSPVRKINWIKDKIECFKASKDDLWMSVTETDSKYRIEKQFEINKNGSLKPLYKNDDIYSLRQNSTKTYHKDGVFYIARNDYILKAKKLFEGNIKGMINSSKSINIDTFDDLNYAKFLLKDEK